MVNGHVKTKKKSLDALALYVNSGTETSLTSINLRKRLKTPSFVLVIEDFEIAIKFLPNFRNSWEANQVSEKKIQDRKAEADIGGWPVGFYQAKSFRHFALREWHF